MTTHPVQTTLGALVAALYDEYLEVLGDPELAAVATSASVEDLLFEQTLHDEAVAA